MLAFLNNCILGPSKLAIGVCCVPTIDGVVDTSHVNEYSRNILIAMIQSTMCSTQND